MPETISKEPIAVIGYGCVLPDATSVDAFWNNLLQGKNSIRDVPADRWDPALYWSADKGVADKTYAKIGAWVTDDGFNGLEYRMPPNVVSHVDPCQRWALAATKQAFQDAGLATGLKGDAGKDFDRDRCAVIIGNAMGGELQKHQHRRLVWPEARAAFTADPDFQALPAAQREAILARAEERYKAGTNPITEDTMPGHLSNVIAGRIANAFNLGGKNFTTDAACASSLAALDAAMDTLRDEQADYVVWGGTDRSMDISAYVQFSKIGALSPDGSRPFDKDANGFVMGEGCAMFILKRLSDAERDGDRIHAVIRGIGSSSDGKGKGITAPNPAGQIKAVERAYADAECELATIGYLEAHGTSTPVGDPVELESVRQAGAAAGTPPQNGTIRVGSVKSNIGHLKAGAGAAGALKAVLALEKGIIPPSINVRELNPRIDWANSPFVVATERVDWTRPANHPRRAAVSSFGFGGTNFHVVLEEHIPGQLKKAVKEISVSTPTATNEQFDRPAFAAHMAEGAAALEAQSLVLDADALPGSLTALPATVDFAQTGQGPRFRDVFRPLTMDGLKAKRRVGLAVTDVSEIPKKLELAMKAATNPAVAKLAFQQGVFIDQGVPKGKVAFLFPGQGTQYVNMGRDLAQKYAVVRNTFQEADEILFDELGGIRLTDILWPTPDTPETQKASNAKLQLTEFTQPAVLAMDVAILRLLRLWGIKPDVVAGHSLGEYGALVAAGVLSFADALHAVAARGREMANVDLPDLGKMASIPADWETVSAALKQVDDYVICANKNCPSQTVIAGSSSGVEKAVALLTGQGLQCIYLPVSAAFHSEIVAPASKPLRNVLGRLDVQSPKVRVLSNVGAQPYPDDPEAIRDNLAVQVASPVEWIGIIERMVDEGVTTFIEVGPKKALTGFCMDILQDRMGRDVVAVCSNHPKKGEIQHINELFAFLGAWGFKPQIPDLNDQAMYTPTFRDPTAAFRSKTSAPAPAAVLADPRIDVIANALAELSRRLGSLPGAGGAAATGPTATTAPNVLPASTGAAATPAHGARASTSHPGVPAKATIEPPADAQPTRPEVFVDERIKAFGLNLDDIGISGISVGLPGADKPLFAEDNWDRILRGDNLIDAIPATEKDKLAEKNIVRLVKGGDGQASFQVINDVAQVIQLAGRRGAFDMAEWGLEGDFASTLDRTFQYAIAAGLEALRDAGIPLQQTYLKTTTGSYLPKEWKLPEPLRDGTGIIFASAFPGIDNLLRDVSKFLADKYAGASLDGLQALYQELLQAIEDEPLKDQMTTWFEAEFTRLQDALPDHGAARYEFNRKFLFNVLSMGHAQLAQFIGARGPNTQVNAACASTTQAVAIAEDWIRAGRCDRVLVVGADDVTSDAMFEWIGAGFLASGAATTKDNVAEAALPFDARRHGMIVGMGAVGLVVEATPQTSARGMRPIAKLLATEVANSAFHGSRLDIDHISQCMTRLTKRASDRYGFDAAKAAKNTVFVSHETYTPARGGSASAEIHALRATFGDRANAVVIANTKGFTGHPQGAGVEDAIALKMLQRSTVPPIANFRDPDPELGDLNLSKGGSYDVRYALRLAAGFGSQVAMTLTQLVAREDERIADAGLYAGWLSQISGLPEAKTEVVNRTLRIVDQGPPSREPVAVPMPVVAAPAVTAATPAVAPAVDADAALTKVVALVATKTGYPVDMLDPDMDMEADLGIDTVKQAELFGDLREQFGVPLDESLQLKDYNTLRKVAGYMAGSAPATSAQTAPAPAPAATAPAAPAPMPAAGPATGDADAALGAVTALVAQKTGYPAEMLEADLDMEADLGIDTVKQAELFGELRAHFGVPMDESLQLKDYNTLRKVAAYMSGSPMTAAPVAATPSAPVAAAAPAATPTPSATRSTGDSDAALVKVTELVAAKTGYPAEMLEADLDMESDLGIDTVKQAELFGELREHFGVPMNEGLLLSDYNTLRKVAGYMAGSGRSGPASAPAQAEGPAPSAATPAPMPAAGDAETALAKVTEMVAAKTGYPAEMLEADLDMEADLGIDTVKQAELFGDLRAHFGVPMREDLALSDYNTLRKVAAYMSAGAAPAAPTPAATLTAPAQPADVPSQAEHAVIVRRAPMLRPAATPGVPAELVRGEVLVVGDADTDIMDAFKEAGFQPSFRAASPVGILCIATRPGDAADARAGALFEAAKAHPIGKGGFVAVITSQDGAHGLRSVRDAAMAAVAGLGKALRKEFPEAIVKVIDVHPSCKDAVIMDEVLKGGTRTEVCFDKAGTRYVVDVAPEALPDATPDVAGKHIIVSGGAQGITVEMLAALAPQGPKLVLLGRTQVPEEANEWATWDDARWKQEEQATMTAMKAAGDKVTPVALQKALSPKRKAAEVQRNLQRLTDLGAEVIYAPVDVTDKERVAEAIAHAREYFGPVDGIIHAAGVEISKDLASKDRAQFDLVFGIKHDGLAALMAGIADDRISWLAAFGSVAGRFGNIGQADYSAVNEYLCKAVKQTATEHGIPTAFTIAWGPWGEVGMATKGSIMQIMEASGVTPIPTQAGVAAFLAEMATPGIRESVVAGNVGAIDIDGQVVAKAWDPRAEQAAAILAADGERFRLIDTIEAIDDRKVTATLVMDQANDPYAKDHAIDGVPYLPGVFGLEAFAQAASLLADGVCTKIEGAKFAVPIKQLKERPVTARIHVERISADTDAEAVFACHMTTRMVGPDGLERGEPRTHFEATLTFGQAESLRTDTVPPCTRELAKDEIYPPFFHGPSFQVLRYAGPLEADESVGSGAMPYAAAFSAGDVQYQVQPLIMEALFQLCGLRTMHIDGKMSLPATIDAVDLFHHGPVNGEVRLWCRHTGTDALRRFDAVACLPDGTVMLRMSGYGMVETGPAPALKPSTPSEAPAEVTELSETPDPSDNTPEVKPKPQVQTTLADEVPIPLASVELPELDDIVFAAVTVPEADADPTWFTEDEIETQAVFKVEKRAAEWRAGRLAVKAAIMTVAPGLKATDIVVHNAEGGAPYVLVQGQTMPGVITITHRDGLAIAAVSETALGIDLETTEARSAGFHEEAFNAAEKDLAADAVGAACVWAAKEAVFKRIGTGLKQALHAWTVRSDDAGGATVSGPDGMFEVRFFDVEGRVLAVSAAALDAVHEAPANA